MFEFTRNFYTTVESGGGSDFSFAPGQIIIPEQTVSSTIILPGEDPHCAINMDNASLVPDKLLIEFDGVEYIVEKSFALGKAYYGEVDGLEPSFNTYPFYIGPGSPEWFLYTMSEGTHTISAKIPEEKSPKVLSFPNGRTIVSELSRLNKAFGNVSKKKTIIGQLSDLTNAAEAGKIGGGSGGAFMVHVNVEGLNNILDKTWQEIYDALKKTSVYIINENEEGMSVSTGERIIEATHDDNLGGYLVRTSLDNRYGADSPDGYPWKGGIK